VCERGEKKQVILTNVMKNMLLLKLG